MFFVHAEESAPVGALAHEETVEKNPHLCLKWIERATARGNQAKRKAAGTGAKSGGKPKERQKTTSSHQRSQQARRGPCDPDLAPGADIVVDEMAIKWRKSKRRLRSQHDQPAAQRVAKPTAARRRVREDRRGKCTATFRSSFSRAREKFQSCNRALPSPA